MLEGARAVAALPAEDLERAKAFYKDTLGLTPAEAIGDDGFRYELGPTEFVVFASSGRASGDHTQLTFVVDDVDSEAEALRASGVVFEEVADLDMKDGIADMGPVRGGWFKDSEGNLLGLAEFT